MVREYTPQFENINDFHAFIHEDECYDENGNFTFEYMLPDMKLGTLIDVANFAEDIYYIPETKSFFSIINKICEQFNVDKQLLKKKKSINYKNVPQKYWGLILQCLRYTYSYELDDGEHNPSYLYYLSVKTRYNSVDEFEEQIMIKNFVNYLGKYINNCICEKKQFLFTHSGGQKEYLPFRCMRYVENEYLCNNLQSNENKELYNMIMKRFHNIKEFKEYIDSPKNFDILVEDDEFGTSFFNLWNEYVAKAKKNSDYPKSYNYPEYFCEQDVKILLEGITHSNGLEEFYNNIKNEYMVTLDNLQAIVDMNYVVNLYPNCNEKDFSHTKCSEISQFIWEKYNEIVERFIPFIKSMLDEADNETDDLQKFRATFTKWIVFNALSENRYLCYKLNEAGINIQYQETSNTKKSKKA